MMHHGLLVFEDSPEGMRNCKRRVAGLSQLDRGIRTLARTGISVLTVLVPAQTSTRLPRHTRRLPLSIRFVTWDDVETLALPGDESVLVVQGDHVHHHSSLTRFVQLPRKQGEFLALAAPAESPCPGAWHVRADAQGLRFTPPGAGDGVLSAGAFICPGARLHATDWRRGADDFHGAMAAAAAAGPRQVVEFSPARWRVVRDWRGARTAKTMLFGEVTKPTSGLVSRHINARVSIPISRVLVGTGMSPHVVTVVFVMTTGLAAAYLIAHPQPYWRMALAGLLWQLAAILDRCDGEVARVKLCESAFGAWFDTLTDNLAYLCAYCGIMLGIRYLHPHELAYAVPGVTAVGALVLTLGIMYIYARRTGSGSLQHYLRDLGRQVADADKTWVQRLMQRYGFVAKRDFFSFIVFLSLCAGQIELAYWFLVVILHLAAGAVLLSQRTMLHSAKQGRKAPGAPGGQR